jgi:hypothetical protein
MAREERVFALQRDGADCALSTKNFAAHRNSRIRDVANDVLKHVS